MASSQGWRDVHAYGRSQSRRWKQAAIFSALMLLIGGFVFILVAPFRHPNTHVIYALTGSDLGHSTASPPFALEQYAQLTPLRPAMFRGAEQVATMPLVSLAEIGPSGSGSPSVASIGNTDAVMIYLSVNELQTLAASVRRTGSNLSSNSDAGIGQVIDRVRRMPGRTKLLILDTTTALVPGDGLLLPDTAAMQVAQAVRQSGDRSLWVLCSHSLLESTHQSAALRRTVFGYFVARGLKGDADLDRNRVITLAELLAYVRTGVAQWVGQISDGHATQTPTLFWGGGQPNAADAAVAILPVVALPPAQRELDVQQSIREAKAPRQRGKWENVFRERAANRLLPFTNPIRDKLTEARVPEATSQLGRLTDHGGSGAASGAADESQQDATAPNQTPPPRESTGDQESSNSASAAANGNAPAAAQPPAATSTDAPDAGANASESEESDDFILPLNPLDDGKLLDQLARAWSIHDQLLEHRKHALRPIDYAPDLWLAYQQQLLAMDQTIRGGWIFETKPLVRVLEEQLLPMEALLEPASVDAAGPGEPAEDRWLEKFLARRPRVAAPEQIHSLALLVASDSLSRRFDTETQAALRRYETLLASGSGEAFTQWVEQAWQPDFETIAELRSTRTFAELAQSDWPLLQRMLRTRLLAERAAVAVASLARFQPWVLRADELRRAGERAIGDRVGENWRSAAEKQLMEAVGEYNQALHAAEAALKIDRVVCDLLADLPYYVALQRHANEHPDNSFPTADDIDDVLSTLASTQQTAAPARVAVSELQATADRLSALHSRLRLTIAAPQIQRLREGSIQPADAWFISLLLQTPLLPVDARMQLIATAAEVDAASLRDKSFADVAPRARQLSTQLGPLEDAGRAARLAGLRQQSSNWSRWQLAFWSLADSASHGDRPMLADSPRVQLADWATATPSTDEFPEAWQRLRRVVASDVQQWPVQLASLTSQAADLSDPKQRPRQIDRLRRIQWATRVIGTRIGPPFEADVVGRRLASAHRYDQLAWLATRDRAAIQSANSQERSWLTTSARDYQTLARRETLQPPLEPIATPAIEIQTLDEVVFAPDQETLATNVTVINRGAQTTDVWLVVNTDDRFLKIDESGTGNLYHEADLRAELNRIADAADAQWLQRLTAAEAQPVNDGPGDGAAGMEELGKQVTRLRQAATYPYRPNRAKLPATVQLRPGESKTMALTLGRTGRISSNTQWTTRAITATDHTRHDTPVLLPDQSAVSLSLDAAPATWSQSEEGMTLYPYPNRPTPYRLALRNTRGRDLVGTVSVLTPHQPLPLSLPATMLSASATDRWLKQVGSTTQLVAPRKVNLPADGTAVVVLPSPKPDDPPKPDEPPTTGGAAASQDQPAGTADTELIAGIAVNHGLLVLVHDEATDTTAIQWVAISPQRPRRYTAASVGYDAAIGRITIAIQASGSAVIPTDGIPVVARVSDDTSRPLALTLSGRITPDATVLRLFADVPRSEDRTVFIEIDVDEFPRAFLFRLHPTASQRSVPEWTERHRVRLTSPAAETAFAPPLETIEVSAAVDAPVGAFLDPHDELQIGIDANRDRVFRGESPLVLRSDRQVDTRLLVGEAGAPVNIIARVRDFQLQVPAGPVTDARVNLLGHLRTGQRDTWSEPVEIVLDGQPPRLGSIRVLPGRSVVEKTPLEISVVADDHGLSGVAGVKLGVAAAGSTDFAEQPPPVEAVLTPGGAWAATLPTEALPPGSYSVLLQAVDRVGNWSRTETVKIDILSTEEMLAEKNRPKPVSGRVMHGTTAAAGAVVDLFTTDEEPSLVATRTADDQGEFRFANVVPGTYQLRGRAVVRNNRRSGELAITVGEGTAVVKPVRLLID